MSTNHKEKILFIVNPTAGGRDKRGFEKLVKENLNVNSFEYSMALTERVGHASEIAKTALTNGIHKIVAVGGDGTVNEVAQVLINTDGILGIIPYGSGNGLARHMGIPMSPAKAVQHLNNASVKINDVGFINNKPFFCTSGMGFDAHIGKIFATLKGRGFSGYIKAVLREFANYEAQDYSINVNGKTFTKNAFLITFANATQYGNNAHIAPKAEVNDGLLDVCILKPFPVYAMPLLALRVFAKTADQSKYMETFRCTEVNVTRASEGPIHLDGEPFELGKEIKVSVLPKGLKILA